MTGDTRTARCELGWLITDEEVEAVHLPEMLDLRRQWPALHENATTSREQVMADLLDVGIASALLAIGVVPIRENQGTFRGKPLKNPAGFTIARAKIFSDETMRARFATVAAVNYEIAKQIATDKDQDQRAHQDMVLAEALSGAGAQLYGGTFAPPVDDEDGGNWWQTLGYDSFGEWLAAPPWWQRDGYSLLAEADADWADGEADE